MAHKRRVLGLTVPDLCVLAAYIAVLCLALPHYQPWEDEGRAWVNARYFGFFQLIFHILRYEGHPVLWYLLLWPLAHLHMPFVLLNWTSAACATAGIYFLLRYSPFPFYLRALLPFGFALAYQFAVVARSYVLFPLLGFMVAHEYRRPSRGQARRPLRMAIFLALFANLSVHATIVSLAFAASYAWNLYKEHRTGTPISWSLRQARLGAALFTASILLVLIVLWPPHNLQPPLSPGMTRFIGRISPAASQPPRPSIPRLRSVALQSSTPADVTPALNLGMGALRFRERLSTVFVYPVATFPPLALAFQALVFILVWRRGKPILLLGHLLLCAFIVQVYLRLWHANLTWVSLILLLWAVWDEHEQPSWRAPSLQAVVAALFALISLLQLPWTLAALRFERTHSTYPAHAAANYLKSLPPQARVDGFDHANTVLPYFTRYPFHLQADVLDVPVVVADRPGVILFRSTTVSNLQLAQLSEAGYRQTRTFCGSPFFPNQPLVPLCLVFLERR